MTAVGAELAFGGPHCSCRCTPGRFGPLMLHAARRRRCRWWWVCLDGGGLGAGRGPCAVRTGPPARVYVNRWTNCTIRRRFVRLVCRTWFCGGFVYLLSCVHLHRSGLVCRGEKSGIFEWLAECCCEARRATRAMPRHLSCKEQFWPLNARAAARGWSGVQSGSGSRLCRRVMLRWLLMILAWAPGRALNGKSLGEVPRERVREGLPTVSRLIQSRSWRSASSPRPACMAAPGQAAQLLP